MYSRGIGDANKQRNVLKTNSSPNSGNVGIPNLTFLFLLSSLAWLYVGGRLWQDAEMRRLLSDILQKNKLNSKQVTRILTFEEQLTNLGCKHLGEKISRLETELALAKSRGYLHTGSLWNSSSNMKRHLAVIGIYTGFGGHTNRNKIRNSWLPTGKALKKLEEEGMVVRFVIGRSPNRGDSLDRKINAEAEKTNDFLVLESHEEDTEELPNKAKHFFSTAIEQWDADFYVKVDDSITLNLGEFRKLLSSHRDKTNVYMGCMKSGDVITEEGMQWYEPEWWKFGDEKAYFRHAAAPLYVLSRKLVRHINTNRDFLNTYAHEDISVGSWMLGLNASYIDERQLCCINNGDNDDVCLVGV